MVKGENIFYLNVVLVEKVIEECSIVMIIIVKLMFFMLIFKWE